MEARRAALSASVVVAFLLSGCCNSEQLIKERTENSRLREQIGKQEGSRMAELQYLEMEAGIAAGCDWVVPLCPESVTTVGRKAQESGFGGAMSLSFWLIFFAKLAFLGIFVVVIWGFGS